MRSAGPQTAGGTFGAPGPARSEQEDSDFSLLERGYVTVTPLTDSLTDPAGFSGKTLTL